GVMPPSRTESSALEADSKLTVGELILAYFLHAESRYRKNGQPTSQVDLVKLAMGPLRKLYGDTPADEFGPKALKAVRQRFIDSGLCRNEVNRRTRLIIRMFKWAVADEMVLPSVHQALSTVEGLRKDECDVRESRKVRPVPDAFVDAVLPHVSRR